MIRLSGYPFCATRRKIDHSKPRARRLSPRSFSQRKPTKQTTDFVATVFDGSSNPEKVTVTFTMALNALLKEREEGSLNL